MNRIPGRVLRSAALAAIALSLSVPTAFAAEATPTAAPAPLAKAPIEVQYWMAGKPNEAVAIITMQLDPSTPLPATVRLPIPKGMVVDWAGEISGGDPTQDPQREYTMKQASGGSYAEFTVSEFRLAQIDVSGKPMSVEGDQVGATFELIQSVDSTSTAFSVRLPAIASEVKIDPEPVGDPEKNEIGEALYTLPTLQLKRGDSSVVDVSYLARLEAPGTTGATDTLIWILFGAAAVVVVVLVVVVVRQKRSV